MRTDNRTAPAPYAIMTKPVGSACNMACSYCYYLEKSGGIYGQERDFRMTEEILELFTRGYIQSQPTKHVVFNWHGGEPMLRGREFFRKAVSYQKKYGRGSRVENTIQTNGLLIDRDWCAFFREHGFLVGVSIDGPRHVHDRYRKTVGGQDTFEAAFRAMDLLQAHGVEFNTLSVVNDYSAQFPSEVYMFLKQSGSRYMQFIPAIQCLSHGRRTDGLSVLNVKESGPESLAPYSVKAHEYGSFLAGIFDIWVANDVGQYFIQFFESVLCAWCGLMPGVCVLLEKCGTAGVIEFNGDIYPCDHYVFPDHRLGNIREDGLVPAFFSERQKQFGLDKSGSLTTYCKRCEYLELCYGECPKNRFAHSPDGEQGHNYLCEGLKHFFRHTEPYMKFMKEEIRNGREPSNVMAWAKVRASGGSAAASG